MTMSATSRRLRFTALLASLGALGAGGLIGAGIPSLDDVRRAHPASHVVAVDARGREVERLRIDFAREREPWVPHSDVPALVREAVIALEDVRFAWHLGVDPFAIGAALRDALRGKRPRGASTISMQVARLVFPSLREWPTALRKPAEAVLAAFLTWRWGREGVMEAWLNLVPMPGAHVGLPSAARAWQGGGLETLTRAEARTLVGWARRPAAVATSSWGESLRQGLSRGNGTAFVEAPHMLASLRSGRIRDPNFRTDATRLRTTVDGQLQESIRLLARDELRRLEGRNATGISVVVLENSTGRVLAYVGNVTASAAHEASWIDAASSRRQAGSTLKPFLYALAFAREVLAPSTALLDAPYEQVRDGSSWKPRNYDGRFHGAVPARVALASSLNIPAVRVLGLVGVGPFAATLEGFGFRVAQTHEELGESLALGSLDVTLVELAAAYAALARGGETLAMRFVEEPWGGSGKAAGSRDVAAPEAGRRVLPAEAVARVTEILASPADRELAFGAHSPLVTSVGAAAKTGTSVDMRDNWCVGYTAAHTVAVWAGNEAGEPMFDVTGVEGAAPLWHDVIELLSRRAGPPASEGKARVARRTPSPGSPPAQAPQPKHVPNRLPRIVAPLEGSLYTRDPGIPAEEERIVFVAHGETRNLSWMLDGVMLAPASDPLPWPPRRGTHELSLVDSRGAVAHRVTFRVK